MVVVSDTEMASPRRPSLIYGLRGSVVLDAVVRGPARDLHSGRYGGAIANPVHALAALVASLHDAAGRVAVDGFGDAVREVAPEERVRLLDGPGEAQIGAEAGVAPVADEDGFSAYERTTIRPALIVTGIAAGAPGAEAKASIPARASARITARLVPEQDPIAIAAALRAHLAARVPAGVRLELALRGASPAVVLPLDHPAVGAAARALRAAYGARPALLRSGGSIPLVGPAPAPARRAGGADGLRLAERRHPRSQRTARPRAVLPRRRDHDSLLRRARPRGEHPMIVDAHCHAGPGDGLTGPWDTDAPLGAYLRRARAAGIARTVIFAPFHSDYRRANATTARIVARDPERLIGFAFVAPARDRGPSTRWWRSRGRGGAKRQGPRQAAPARACRPLRRGRPARRSDLLAPQYPAVSFIVPHLGSFADDWRAHRSVIDQIARLPNVYADTSGVRRFDYLAEAVRRAGPGKLIFGSDGPWLHAGLELEKIRLLRLPPPDEALVTGGTILRLLGGTPAARPRCAEAARRTRKRASGGSPRSASAASTSAAKPPRWTAC